MTRDEKLLATFKIYNLVQEARDTAAAHDLEVIAAEAAHLMELIHITGTALFNEREDEPHAQN